MPAAIVVDNVSKKFLIGSARYSSLRDVIARPVRRLLSRAAQSETERTREFWALKDVSFEVEKGSTLGIIGPNGAGKSTLLKLMSRVSKPTKGAITMHGRVSALIEVGAGFHPELTGRENVYLNGSILGMAKKEIDKKFDAIVNFSGLDQFIDTPVKYYSSGMHVRLGFAVAASLEPEILLVDEVLSVGDFAFQRKCLQAMESFRSAGIAIVLVSHNLETVANFCQRAILLANGSVVTDSDPAQAVQRYYEAYTYDKQIESEKGKPVVIRSVRVLDQQGRPVAQVDPGQRIAIEVFAEFLEVVKDPAFGLFIRRGNRECVFDSSSRRLGFQIKPEKALGNVRGHFDLVANLAPGRYSIGCHVERGTEGAFYDYRDGLGELLVVGPNSSMGACHLAPEFHLSYPGEGHA